MTDEDLLTAIAKQDADAFGEFFKRFEPEVIRHLTRIVRDTATADDITQDVFYWVWERSGQWSGRGSARGWLLTIATNLALNHLRTVKRRREQFSAYSEARPGDAPSDLDWDQKLAEAWLPITGWLDTFLHTQPTSQLVQSTNWLDRTTHLRRITLVPIAFAEGSSDKPHITPSLPTRSHYLMSPEDAASVVPPDLACPIIQPEGPNMGWIIEVARGAEIRDGRLVRIEGADPKTRP